MTSRLVICIILFLCLDSCFAIKTVVYKSPTMGVTQTTVVGEKMVYFKLYTGIPGFGEEITYKGISGNVITLNYNRWDKNYNYTTKDYDLVNKPIDLQYTLNSQKGEPTDITVKTYSIRIIAANNNTITFILLAGMWNRESD